jgi:hypothetical protein
MDEKHLDMNKNAENNYKHEEAEKRKELDTVKAEIKQVNEAHKKELDKMEQEQNNQLDKL